LAPGALDAQGPARSGFWLEGAIGTGTVRNSCHSCDDVTVAYGSADYFRVGGSLSPRVLVGLEVFTLNSSELVLAQGAPPAEVENASIAPIVMWYVGRSGFFLKGGAGVARGNFLVQTSSGEAVTTKRTGSSLTFGLGFDIGVARWLALTANLGTYITAIGDVDVDGTAVDDLIATIYEAGVGISLR
jgi:hypothetical protein